jgi:hypothetical protein
MANTHAFNVQLAVSIGLHEALILQHFWYWHQNNKLDISRYKAEHRYPWSYNTLKSISEIFPYMGISQIRLAIEKLTKAGWIISGNFNQLPFDKTKWYAITEMTFNEFEGVNKKKPVCVETTNESC